jgi:hypothetical protein
MKEAMRETLTSQRLGEGFVRVKHRAVLPCCFVQWRVFTSYAVRTEDLDRQLL